MTTAVVGFSGLSILSPASQAFIEHAPYPAIEVQPNQPTAALSPQAMSGLGKIAAHKTPDTQPKPTDLPTSMTAPIPARTASPSPIETSANVPPLINLPVSPERRKQLAENTAYVNKVLLPAIKQNGDGLSEVKPFNTGEDPVNSPGQFIVKDKNNPTCGSQFNVNISAGKESTNHIDISVFGPVKILADGSIYGRAAYSNELGLAHTESSLNDGKDFRNPRDAVAYAKEINAKVCHIEPNS
jgi:hypothetical protein